MIVNLVVGFVSSAPTIWLQLPDIPVGIPASLLGSIFLVRLFAGFDFGFSLAFAQELLDIGWEESFKKANRKLRLDEEHGRSFCPHGTFCGTPEKKQAGNLTVSA